jgi:hypothetical protein
MEGSDPTLKRRKKEAVNEVEMDLPSNEPSERIRRTDF